MEKLFLTILLSSVVLLAACSQSNGQNAKTTDTEEAAASLATTDAGQTEPDTLSQNESESASLPETLTLYYYKDNKPVQKDLTDSALIETFTRLYDASGLKESEQQYRGIPSFFLDFHNGYVVGVYEDLPYCYIGDSLKKEENHLWVEGKTAMKVGYTLSEEAWKLLLDQVK